MCHVSYEKFLRFVLGYGAQTLKNTISINLSNKKIMDLVNNHFNKNFKIQIEYPIYFNRPFKI